MWIMATTQISWFFFKQFSIKWRKGKNAIKNFLHVYDFFAQFLLFHGFRSLEKCRDKVSIQATFERIKLCLALNLASVKSDHFLKLFGRRPNNRPSFKKNDFYDRVTMRLRLLTLKYQTNSDTVSLISNSRITRKSVQIKIKNGLQQVHFQCQLTGIRNTSQLHFHFCLPVLHTVIRPTCNRQL